MMSRRPVRTTRSTVRRCVWCVGVIAGLALVKADGASAQHEGDDTVLRQMIRGVQAFYARDTEVASATFDSVTSAVGAIWGGTPEAAKARQLWYAESVKPFRGEAYERMMAYYYRGLLYLETHDFGNAQAAFRLSIEQDAYAEEQQARSDVVAPLYLLGIALQAQGSNAEAASAFDALHRLRPDLPEFSPRMPMPSVILIAETGFAPRKVPDGLNAERMRIFRGKNFAERTAAVSIDGAAPSDLWPMDDIYYQASTRGGRPIDYILKGKAHFANSTAGIGSAFADLGSHMALQLSFTEEIAGSSNGNAGNTAAAMTGADVIEVLGAASQLVGALVKPAADVRYWDNLPDAVHMLPLELRPGSHTLAVTFADAAGHELPELSQRMTVAVDSASPRPLIAWVSSRPRQSAYLAKK